MTFIESIILGVVEGVTEFLPISSTGHLILASHLLGIPQTDFVKSFEIAIQLGSILAVLILFWRSFLNIEILKRLVVAFIPTGIVGFLLYQFIKDVLIGNPSVVIYALAFGGVVIILIEYFNRNKVSSESDVSSLTFMQSFLVGVAQSLAIIPGVSRSGATVMGGLLLGISRTTILTFSFLLAVPTMILATAYDVYRTPEVFIDSNLALLSVGFVTAFILALLTIRAVLSFVRTHSFVVFGVYRILLAGVFWFFIF
jgi:undecaprenyl-diphosphatase